MKISSLVMLIRPFSTSMGVFDVMLLEKVSIHPLAGTEGQWIKYVAQGYEDRWGCTEVQSWAPPSGR